MKTPKGYVNHKEWSSAHYCLWYEYMENSMNSIVPIFADNISLGRWIVFDYAYCAKAASMVRKIMNDIWWQQM